MEGELMENTVGDYSIGMFPESTVNSIFKKSEHEEIMDELEKIRDEIKRIKEPMVPYIPYVPPRDPCRYCCPGWGCGNCPYRYDPNWNRFYPTPYYDHWRDTGNIGFMPMTVLDTCIS